MLVMITERAESLWRFRADFLYEDAKLADPKQGSFFEEFILIGDHNGIHVDGDNDNELEVDGDGDDAVGGLVPRLGEDEGHGQEGDRKTAVSVLSFWCH